MKVAIIGSGIAAISAAKALVKRGVKPIILDKGEDLDPVRKSQKEKLASTDPKDWDRNILQTLTHNPSIKSKGKFPEKLAFGSGYFYGNSNSLLPVVSDDVPLPFTYAKGGFSKAWGASILPPDADDLKSWPLDRADLDPYFKEVLEDIPYSAVADKLCDRFPLYTQPNGAVELTSGNKQLLEDMNNSKLKKEESVLFGQSRLLVRLTDDNALKGCKKCGYCMSGCVYDSIYKSDQDLDKLIASGKVEYISGVIVTSLEEKNSKVTVSIQDAKGLLLTLEFDRVFVAAGAVGSTRLVLQSKKLYDVEVKLLSTVAFVAPMLRFKKFPVDWPVSNTMPGIFLEYKINDSPDKWVHAQISTPNELVYGKFNVSASPKGILSKIKKNMMGHFVLALCNLHSDYSNGYLLSLKKSETGADYLMSKKERTTETRRIIKTAAKRLSSLCRKAGLYTLLPLVQNTMESGGYHVGGTLPMSLNPQNDLQTDIMGRPKGWNRIHVIDSSIFPSLPGTTIGLLAMANATRIANETLLD